MALLDIPQWFVYFPDSVQFHYVIIEQLIINFIELVINQVSYLSVKFIS